MPHQELFDNLQHALNNKQSIVNNQHRYWHTETIATKHSTRFLGFRGEPYYTYHDERTFDHGKYQHDLSQADQNVNRHVQAIEDTITHYREERRAAQINEQIDLQQIRIQNNEIAHLRSLLASLQYTNNNLNNEIAKGLKQTLQTYFATTSLSSETLRQQAEAAQERIAKLEQDIKPYQKAIFELLKTADVDQRAHIYAKFYDQAERKDAVDIIESLGFDANELAYIAIKENSPVLFGAALEHGANITTCCVESKTLLQHIIQSNQQELLRQTLTQDFDLSTTILNALSQNDQLTFNILLDAAPKYTQQVYHGYSVLHIAICSGNLSLTNKIMAIDPDSTTKLTSQNESAFKIALRSSTPEIIQSVGAKLKDDLQKELKQFIQQNEEALFERAVSTCNFTDSVKSALLQYALSNNNTAAASYLIKSAEVSADEIFKQAVVEHDDVVMYGLLEINFDHYQELMN